MDDEQITKLAKQRVEERAGLVVHAAMYALVNVGLIIAWRLTGSSYPWFIWPLLGWGAGLMAHGLTYWFGPNSRHGAKAFEREVQRLRTLERG